MHNFVLTLSNQPLTETMAALNKSSLNFWADWIRTHFSENDVPQIVLDKYSKNLVSEGVSTIEELDKRIKFDGSFLKTIICIENDDLIEKLQVI